MKTVRILTIMVGAIWALLLVDGQTGTMTPAGGFEFLFETHLIISGILLHVHQVPSQKTL
jgi:hypothetical protein